MVVVEFGGLEEAKGEKEKRKKKKKNAVDEVSDTERVQLGGSGALQSCGER